MNLGELKPAKGSTKKSYRRGRGHASGNGKTAGKGHKGQNARAGGGVRPGFEGGQMPIYRRLPKRGFTSRNSKNIITVNVELLNVFEEGTVVDIAALKSKGLVSHPKDGVKILGEGTLTKKLDVKVNFYSKSAEEKIVAKGGSVEVI